MNLTLMEPICSTKPRKRFQRFLIFAMRTSIFYMAFVTFSMQFLLAHNGKGQSIDSTYLQIEVENQTLESLIKRIESKTHLRFTFLSVFNSHLAKDLPTRKMSVSEILELATKNSRLTFIQVDNNYVIIRNKADTLSSSAKEIKKKNQTKITTGSAPNFLVTGTIKDADTKAPIPGVNVVVKGTTRGTTSDAEGRFSIEAEENEVLVFSFIGYKAFQTQVGSRTEIDVFMETDITPLKEVIINAGYWHINKSENTGNIAKITAKEIQNNPVGNPIASLQGRIAGVDIQQNSGAPGSAFEIKIRGRNSVRPDGNNPLYIIDGVPYPATSLTSKYFGGAAGLDSSPLNYINPQDIESIEVLKDADATAIYGSRGANGVILISTTKGKSEKINLNVNFYKGVGEVTRKIDLLNTQEYLQMRKEAFKNDKMAPESFNGVDLLVWDTTRYTDWQEKLIGGTANLSNLNISLSGGNETTGFLIGTTYYRETTVMPSPFSDEKKSMRFNISSTSLNKKFKSILSGNYLINKNSLPQNDIVDFIKLSPNAPEIYDEEGNLNWANSTWINPFASLIRKDRSTTNNLLGNLELSYEIIPELEFKSVQGYINIMRDGVRTTPKRAFNPAFSIPATSNFYENQISTWIVEPQLNYKKTFKQGVLAITVGSTFQESKQKTSDQTGTGFTSEAMLENIKAAPSITINDVSNSRYRYNALFGRLNYNWNEKYIMNITGRRDGSSRFGPGKQFANFGALGIAWIFSKENFIKKNLPLFSYGKIRGSYGTTGNDQIPDYGYLDTYSANSGVYQQISALNPTQLFNPDFAWEISRKIEGGIELGFLENRVQLSTSYFINRSSNQLVGLSLPAITGFTSVTANRPATVQNSGWEIEVTTTNINSQNFRWTTSTNLSIVRNKLIDYPNLEGSTYADVYIIGQPLDITKQYHNLGVDKETGVYQIQDINDDGIINSPNDNKVVKIMTPDFFGGLHSSFEYKGLQFELSFYFIKQIAPNYQQSFDLPGSLNFTRTSNQPIYVLDRWQTIGDKKDIQKFTQDYSSPASEAYYYFADNTISDASFIRLKNVILSYQFPEAIIKKGNLQNLKIYMQGQNILTITNYKGLDPETRGLLPPLKVLTFGIQFSL